MYEKRNKINVKITNITPYGAFCRAERADGLIHISEVSDYFVKKLRAKKNDISIFNQDISGVGDVEIESRTPQSVLEGLLNSPLVYNNISKTLYSALQDSKIIITFDQTIPKDGAPHVIEVKIDGGQTENYFGTAILKTSLIIK